ncbi:MAG TPA: OsmC family protein [Ramlibacter sp.]
MQSFPHHYQARATGGVTGPVDVRGPAPAAIETWPPPEFDGQFGEWSPESLLVAAVADCFVLTFRAVARAAHLEWDRLDVDVAGTLERIDGVTRFTRMVVAPHLTIIHAGDAQRVQSLLEKAERGCLVSNSLTAEVVLQPHPVTIATAAAA